MSSYHIFIPYTIESFYQSQDRNWITERLRFFIRVRFESGDGVMVGFEYEKLRMICNNCCRINHHLSHCPYLAPPVFNEDILDIPVVPQWEAGESSNNHNLSEESHPSQIPNISSYSPISQPPRPATPMPNLEEFVAADSLQSFPSSRSSFMQVSSDFSSGKGFKATTKYEIGESSKRKKGKQINIEHPINTRQCRKDPRVRFYPVTQKPP